SRQCQRDQFRWNPRRSYRHDDELAAADHIGHRQSGFIRGQFHFVDGPSSLLIKRAKFPPAALWSGREQTSAVTGKEQRLRNEQRSAFRIPRPAQINSGERRMFSYILRSLAIRNHPNVFARVEVDRCDPPPWRLDERQSQRRLYSSRPAYVTHVRAISAFTKRARPPVRHRRNIQDSGFGIRGRTLPIGRALIVPDCQCAEFATGALNYGRRVERSHLEL